MVPAGAPVKWWHQLLRSAGPAPVAAHVDPERDAATFIYTGGTTGVSKGAVLSHRNIVANAMQTVAYLELEEGHEVVMCALPFFHSFGMAAMNVGLIVAGKIVPLPNPRDLRTMIEEAGKEKPTFFPGVPRMFIALNESPLTKKVDLRSLKACISGGAPLPVAVADRYGEHVPPRRRDAAREVPVAAHLEAAVDPAPAALRERDPGGDQRVRIRAPDLVLRALVVERQEPVVDAEVADVPPGRGAPARDLGGHVDERHEVELHSAVAPRLDEAEEAGAMQVGRGLRQHVASGLGPRGALAQGRDEIACALERLVVGDTREARRAPQRSVHRLAAFALAGATRFIFE